MRTDSIVRRSPSRWLLFGLCLLLALGCAKAPTVVVDELLDPVTLSQPWLPNAADFAAARLARAALIAQAPDPAPRRNASELPAAPSVEAALDDLIEKLDVTDAQHDQENLESLAIDLRNATLDDPNAYRAEARNLRKRWGLDPRLRGRLDRIIGDDPLRLAGRRQFDGWHRLWARTFNSVAEPLGSSAITGFVIAPFALTNSLIHYFAEFSNAEPLSLTDRQALDLRKEFLGRHPDTEATPALEKKIARAQLKLEKTLALRRLRAADTARDSGALRLAAHHAKAALRIVDAHPEENARTRKRAKRLAARIDADLAEERRLAARSLEANATSSATREAEYRLAAAVLAGPARPASLAAPLDAYREAAGEKRAAGRIEFVRALAQVEVGLEAASRKRLRRVVALPETRDPMPRHARALLEDDWQNPFGAFERLHRTGIRTELAWRLAGEWVKRPRYPNLPAPLAYLIDTPTIAMTIVLAPLRALISPWTGSPDFQGATAVAGYRYLVRFPDGEEQRPVIDWLYDYEIGRERWGRALRLADWIPDFDAEKRLDLVEKTAEERLVRVERMDRRDNRASMLRGIAQEFPDSSGGHAAGLTARRDREEASPQSIRITKDFLLENPAVASADGIGLNSRLLNDDPGDGELHPEGVVLRGGRILEIRLIAEGGDEDALPETQLRKVSKERLTRIAAALDEAVRRNSLIDADAQQAPDANRDRYLERAGLGLTDDLDVRAAAESSFVYRSLRERYGMVRGRDSILPFDLVFRGSLGDFSLGAFPRWREPRETPDAFLYR